ncbi:20260_t:CDS:2 [Entrophospora sp. SA101]|nr:20260_t:CDS:2 [Entrophospora sp. SA101]
MSSTDNFFSFSWRINCFNELAARHPNETFFYSERFWSPRGQPGKTSLSSSPSTAIVSTTNTTMAFNENNILCGQTNNHNNTCYLWRLKMFPNGVDKKSNDHLSLYLEAIHTQYEKVNGIGCRQKKFRLSLFRIDPNNNNNPQQSQQQQQLSLQQFHRHTLETKFEFNGSNSDYGFARIIALKDLFPITNENLYPEMDLLVRVQIFNDLPTGEGTSSIANIFDLSLGPFEKYFEVEKFYDIEFVFDCGSVMKAHRVILAARSAYFENLLGGEWKEGHMKTIAIRDMPYKTFRSIVHHLYTNKLEDDLTFELLREIFSKADMLGIPQLETMAAERMVRLINSENWDQILMLGWEFQDNRLRTAGLEFAIDNWTKIRDTENMKQVMECGNMDWIEELILGKFLATRNVIVIVIVGFKPVIQTANPEKYNLPNYNAEKFEKSPYKTPTKVILEVYEEMPHVFQKELKALHVMGKGEIIEGLKEEHYKILECENIGVVSIGKLHFTRPNDNNQ